MPTARVALADSTAGTRHVHAKVGGGKTTHTHDDVTPGHKHKGLLGYKPSNVTVNAGAGGDVSFDEGTALLALNLDRQQFDCAEKRLPYLVKGEWQFDDYGSFIVGDDELNSVVDTFRAGARRQHLPVNESHNPDRAIGWIRDLERVGDRVDAVVDLNPVGDQLLADDQYRYCSPELLRRYKDAETGKVWEGVVATGHSITNKPRLKSLGQIACSEGVDAGILAFSETVSTADPTETARVWLADMQDDDDDDDGPVPLCIYQPRAGFGGSCPGFTRFPGDDDGDGTCLMATKGCNGYRACDDDDDAGNSASGPIIRPITYSEGDNRMPDTPIDGHPAAAGQPDEDVRALLMAEQTKRTELETKFHASEAERVTLAETVAAMRREKTVGDIRGELNTLSREGRITPAEMTVLLADDDAAIKLSENRFVIEAIKARPAVVSFGEIGSGDSGSGGSAEAEIQKFAEEIRRADPKLSLPKARLVAIDQHPELREQYDQERRAKVRAAVG